MNDIFSCKYSRDKALSDDELLQVFDECDVDHSGTISWNEFKQFLGERGFGLEFIEVCILLFRVCTVQQGCPKHRPGPENWPLWSAKMGPRGTMYTYCNGLLAPRDPLGFSSWA